MSSFIIIFLVGYLIYTGMYQLILGKIPGSKDYEEVYTEESIKKYAKIGGIECLVGAVLIGAYELVDTLNGKLFPDQLWWVIGGGFIAILLVSFFLIMKKK